jgi:hypothetical protein
MQNGFLLSAIGHDKPGLVAARARLRMPRALQESESRSKFQRLGRGFPTMPKNSSRKR